MDTSGSIGMGIGATPCQADFSLFEPTNKVASGFQKERHPYGR